jgi:hypothetical protein
MEEKRMKKNKKFTAEGAKGRRGRILARAEEKENLSYRTISIAMREDGAPASLDEKTRSIEVVGATENPVEVWDWERYELVRETLLMSGCVLPQNRQTVLLDTHQRGGTGSVVGSYRDMRVVGAQMVGRAHFTSLPEGDAPYVKVKEGHVTDFSVGYRVAESEWVKAGESKVIQGRKFEGPLRVTTKWVPREMSVCPLGADEMAKARGELKIENLKLKIEEKKEEQRMKKELRELLIKRGMNADATDDEAWAFLEKHLASERALSDAGTGFKPAPTEIKTETPDAQTISRESVRVERERVAEIEAMASKHGVEDTVRAGWIKGGVSVEDARKAVLKLIEEKAASQKLPPSIEFVADDGEKFRAAAADSLILRGGKTKIEKPAPGALELRGYRMVELARLCLQRAGVRPPWDPMEMVGRAMTVGDLPYIFADVANKSLFGGFNAAPETWMIWCDTGTLPDFNTHNSARASEADDLDLIPDGGEYKYGTLKDANEQMTLATYGKLFAVTRHTIINEALGVITSIPFKHGAAWARKIGDLAYAVLTGNPTMGDGKALFIAAHGNIGTGGALTEVTLNEGDALLGVQKNIKEKQVLNIPLVYYVAPRAIKGSSEIFFRTANFTKTNEASTRTNIWGGDVVTRAYDARLDASSATQYYLLGPKGLTVTVFFLNGVQTPFMETKQGWTVDGVEFKVRGDAAAKAMDWRGMVRNAGL